LNALKDSAMKIKFGRDYAIVWPKPAPACHGFCQLLEERREYIFSDSDEASLPAPGVMATYSESGDMSLARSTYRVRGLCCK
jgi:hypothetical protein